MDFSHKEPSIESYSDTKCRDGNHDHVADNHARPKVLRRASHDRVQTNSHDTRLKIALAKEVIGRKWNSNI